ncbi:MAG: hypothetical protein Q7R95_11405 [bacterium]|nr:hypothetical protein [bacterium]
MIDIIRNGKFVDTDCEKLRKRIVSKDCGLVSSIINVLNKEISNIRDTTILKEILANYAQEIEAELP